MSQSAYPDLDQVRWLAALNVSGAEIPPFGVVRLVEMNTDGQFEVDYPEQDSYPFGLAFNGPTTIPIDGTGSVTTDLPFWARFEPSEGSGSGPAGGDNDPIAGEIWGPVAGSFSLAGNQTGFRVLSTGNPFDLDAIMVILDPFALSDDAGSGSGGSGSTSGGCVTSTGTSHTRVEQYCDADGNPQTRCITDEFPFPVRRTICDSCDEEGSGS